MVHKKIMGCAHRAIFASKGIRAPASGKGNSYRLLEHKKKHIRKEERYVIGNNIR
jgi:hypothetical protein